jgi:outer membrane protein TolC
MKSFIISSAIFLLWLPTYSQTSAILDHYVAMGIERNTALQEQVLDVESSLESLRQAKGLFLPQISLNSSYMWAQGGRGIEIPVGDLINPIYRNLNTLNDQNQFPTNLANEEFQLLPDNFHDTRIEMRQPIFNAEIYHNYRLKGSLVDIEDSKRQTYQQELIKELKIGYYQYLRALSVERIYQNTRLLLQELLRVNRSLVENHKATIDAVYRAEFEISEIDSKLAQATKTVSVSGSYFNFLLNRDLNTPIEIDSNLVLTQDYVRDVIELQELALERRSELDQLEYAIESETHLLNLHRGQKLPNLSLGAQAGYQGFGYDFSDNQDYALLSINLEIPLFNGFQNNSRVQQSKIALNKLQLQQQNLENQIKLEVIETTRNFQAARASYESAIAAARSARKNFDIVSRKYQENLVLLVEFLDARTKYTNSQTSQAIAYYQLLISEAQLERATSL